MNSVLMKMNNPRIAWLLTSAFYYWHPMLSCLAQPFPQTTAFTANWRGYAPGFEDSFNVEVVGQRKVIALAKSDTSYGLNFTFLPLGIINRLLRFKPDVIFSNSFGMWTILALLLKPLGRWRVVIAYEGSSPGVDYRNSPVRLAMRRVMVKAADSCITNSQAGQSYLIDILNASRDRVFAHPYEVPSIKALSESATITELEPFPHPIFLSVGNLTPRKGLPVILKACALLQQQGYHNYTLCVVGDGPQRQELEEFCQQYDLTQQVKWIGRVDYGCLGTYFRQADVFVLPTFEDTWGVVVLEAMAFGKPVLCSNQAGAAELVLDGKNGYCFDPQRIEELAAAMRGFIQTPDLANVMGDASQELMKQYSPEAAAQFLAQVATAVLNPAPLELQGGLR